VYVPRSALGPACAVILTLASASASAAAPSVPASARRSEKPATIAIDNFGRVNDNYYRGAQPQGRDYADLAALGVKTIVDLTADGEASATEASAVTNAGMRLVRIPLTTHDQPSGVAVATFLALVNDPANQPVYVHCQGGRHRTGVMTAIYRMTYDGWSPDRAYAEMQQFKFGPAFLHASLKDFVYGYRVPSQIAMSAMAPAGAVVDATHAGQR
jgi:protein tyrosine/serine phosphatase